jgi:hypothetical protein
MKTTRLEILRKRYGITASDKEGLSMAFQSAARIPMTKASRYLQQLCKHWSHNLTVEFTPDAGKVVFPRDARGADWPGDATLLLLVHEDSLECRLEASAEGQLEALKGAVARHLERFAFRDAPLQFDWQDA